MSGLCKGSCNLDGITICLNINHRDRSGGEILLNKAATKLTGDAVSWLRTSAHLFVGCGMGWDKSCFECHYEKYSSRLHPSVLPTGALQGLLTTGTAS